MTFIIAEAGVNHNGEWTSALDLIDAAKEAGADAVKFQHFNSQRLWGDDRIKHLQLDYDQLRAIWAHCQELEIEFMCTPFGVEELRELLEIGIKRIKISSGCINRRDLLRAARGSGKPVIMSTGMSSISEINEGLGYLGYHAPALYKTDITLLHCVSSYPCPLEEVNLKAMDVMKRHWGDRCKIGYSDHTDWITASVAAVAMGAEVIEKHLTLNKFSVGPDHKASIMPKDFKFMVDEIRNVEKLLGEGVKKVQPSELHLKTLWRANDSR